MVFFQSRCRPVILWHCTNRMHFFLRFKHICNILWKIQQSYESLQVVWPSDFCFLQPLLFCCVIFMGNCAFDKGCYATAQMTPSPLESTSGIFYQHFVENFCNLTTASVSRDPVSVVSHSLFCFVSSFLREIVRFTAGFPCHVTLWLQIHALLS